jgi:hypothetical protein
MRESLGLLAGCQEKQRGDRDDEVIPHGRIPWVVSNDVDDRD